MLRIARVLAVVVGVASFAASGMLLAAQAYIHEFQGTVTAALGAGQPVPAQKNMNLESNTTVATGAKSFAVIKFEDGTSVLLKENTSFQIQNYLYDAKAPEKSNALFNLVRGGLRMITGLVTSKNREALKVASPLATIGIRGTEFMMELVNPLFVQVVNGVVSITNAAGTVLASASQAAVISSASALGNIVPISQLPAGVLQFPNFPLTPVPTTIPPGPVVGAGLGPAGVAAAVAAGAAAAAAATSNNDNTPAATTTHH